MNTLTLQVPDTFDMEERDTLRFLAAKLYECGKLSLGQAAELAGLTKTTFAEILSDYHVSFINYGVEEVLKDAAAF